MRCEKEKINIIRIKLVRMDQGALLLRKQLRGTQCEEDY